MLSGKFRGAVFCDTSMEKWGARPLSLYQRTLSRGQNEGEHHSFWSCIDLVLERALPDLAYMCNLETETAWTTDAGSGWLGWGRQLRVTNTPSTLSPEAYSGGQVYLSE